jgi:hypothetical protein
MGTFNDLSKRGDDSCGFLADSPARAVFAQGVVEVYPPPNPSTSLP